MVTQSDMSFPSKTRVNVNDFRNPPVPDNDGLEQAIEKALEHLEQCSIDNIKDIVIFEHIQGILEQIRAFRELTHDSVSHCKKFAGYASDIIEYVDIMLEEDVLGSDFIEAMKSQIQAAFANKNNATKLTKGYCDILANLKNILNELEERNIIGKRLEQDVAESKKEQFQRTLAAVGTGIGTGVAIVAAPFTGGASLAVIGALGATSAGAMIGTSITSVQYGERARASELELKQIDDTKMHINITMTSLTVMVDKFSCFDEFFKQESEDITRIIEKYKVDVDQTTFRISRMKGTAMKKQWGRVQQVFDSYADLVFKKLDAFNVKVRERSHSISSQS